MDAQDFRSLQEAYMEVVENQQLDEANRGDEHVTSSMYMSREPETKEAKVRRRQKRDGLPDNPSHQGDDKDYDRQWAHKVERGRKKLKPYSSQTLEGEKNPTGKYAAMQRRKRQGLSYKEQVDLYDIILSHLLDEGYAETVESAQAIMVNMSEDWRDEIVEEMLDEALTGNRGRRAIKKFQDQNDRPNFYRKPGESKNPSPNYTLGAVARHKEGSPNRYNPATPEDYADSGNRPTKRGGRGGKGEPKTGYYGTDRRDSDRGRGNAARRRMENR